MAIAVFKTRCSLTASYHTVQQRESHALAERGWDDERPHHNDHMTVTTGTVGCEFMMAQSLKLHNH